MHNVIHNHYYCYTAQLAIDIVESGHWRLEIALVIDDYQFARKTSKGN